MKGVYLIIVLSMLSCASLPKSDLDWAQYKEEYHTWSEKRLQNLKRPYGWTSVVGLYPLSGEEMTFGSGEDNDLVFPDTAPKEMGTLTKKNGEWTMQLADDVSATANDNQLVAPVVLRSDYDSGGPTVINSQNLQWYLMDRKGRNFIRLRDTLSPYRQALTHLETFDLSPDYVVEGRFSAATPGDSITYNTVIGVPYTVEVQGYIDFELHGESQRLTALPGGQDTYFLIIGDETTGDETYGGGRFMYIPFEKEDGSITLDFNRAINPPCVFTPYATCPLPPADNVLRVPIRAGEKMMHLY